MKFKEIIEINGNKLTKAYIESLNEQERLDLIDPIFEVLRKVGFIYPDDADKVKSEWKKLVEFQPDINETELFNNSSLATNICQYFCHKFYEATDLKNKTMINNFNDDLILKRIIKNRLGLDWLKDDDRGTGVNEAFNLSFKMIVFQGQRSMRLVNGTSMFKPNIAKHMYMKYSDVGDTVFDYSAGWGGRMLGAASCNRKYIGADPLTTDEISNMAKYLGIKDVTLIKSGSEDVKLDENSVDFSFSSPPYFDQEVYSKDITQAYNKGEGHFYDTYWKNTLENVRFMLKPGKWFGLNVKNYPKMVTMAEDVFGNCIEKVGLRTIKNHLSHKTAATAEKLEYVYMFKNIK